jgi:hypothetical protein
MSDPYEQDDATTSPYPSLIPPLEVNDPARAERYAREHGAKARQAGDQFERILRERADAIAQTKSSLADTIAELRARHSGAGPGQLNIPLLAFASGLLTTQPGVASNFGNELGRGLGNMAEAAHRQRMTDTDYLKSVAELQQKMASLEDLPLRDAATLARQSQIQEQGAVSGLEKALITSKANRPQSLGSGLIFDPASGRVTNAFTGAEVNIGGSGKPGEDKPQHISLLGSDTHGEDYLKTIPDPVLRDTVRGYINYDQAPPNMQRSPQAMQYMQLIYSMAKQADPDFDPKEYPAIQKAMKDWRGSGKMNTQVLAAANATKHIGNLQEAAAGLDNNSFKAINNMRNILSDNTDDPRVQRFQAALLPVVEEMTKFLGGGKPAEGTMQQWLKTVGAANGPRTIQSAVQEYIKIMHTQLENMANSKNNDLRLKGDKRVSPEVLLSGSGKEAGVDNAPDVVADVLRNDISTPAGMYAVRRRGENTERALRKETPLPQFNTEQFNAAAKQLRAPTDERLKALSVKERKALFDQMFGAGAADAAMGAK